MPGTNNLSYGTVDIWGKCAHSILEPSVLCSLFAALKTHSGDPFDSLPKSFWYEFSSPFTESYDDLTEAEPRTTPDPLPFFEDHVNSTNVTTQLGSAVFLHCKVNDLRDRTVSHAVIHFCSLSLSSFHFCFSFRVIIFYLLISTKCLYRSAMSCF
jgi:hypothetical protein